MQTLQIIKSLGRGGAETLLAETLKVHNQKQFEFHYIYFLPWKNQLVESLLSNGGKVTCIEASNNIQLLLKVRAVIRYVKAHNIKLIHAHLPWAGIVARIAGALTNVPVIYTEHNKQERYHFATRWMNLATLNALTMLVAVSKDVEQSILRFKPTLKAPLRTLVNGVNLTSFNPEYHTGRDIRTELGITKNAFVIGTIAVFRSQKRIDLWIDVAKEIIKKRPGTHFIIVGDGPLREVLVQKIDQLHLRPYVHMVGLQTEVRPYLATFDLYMMSSIFEGLPIALLEAMASSVAVISTDAGGIKEVIRPGVDGLLCSVKEPDKLTDLAIELIDDPAKRNRLAAQARVRVSENFSLEKMVKSLEDLYYDVLSVSKR